MRSTRSGTAFSLIELLLVVAIMGFLTAVMVPAIAKSIKGSKLRTAVRAVVVSGKYARTMSLLKQQELAVSFDFASSTVSVYPASVASSLQVYSNSQGKAVSQGQPAGNTEEPSPLLGETTTVAPPAARPGDMEMTRKLEGVRFEYVEVTKGLRVTEGTCVVPYRSNGTCLPYEVRVIDERGLAVMIRFDALSSATTEAGR